MKESFPKKVKILPKKEFKFNPNTIKAINSLCGQIEDKYERELIRNDFLYKDEDIN
jgi:hypothetical protein